MAKKLVEWCLTLSLSLLFLAVGVAKFRSPMWESRFVDWGYPAWAAYAVGAIEILGAMLLLVPATRVVAAILLGTVMAGAAVTHLLSGEAPRAVVNVVLAGLLLLAARARRRTAV